MKKLSSVSGTRGSQQRSLVAAGVYTLHISPVTVFLFKYNDTLQWVPQWFYLESALKDENLLNVCDIKKKHFTLKKIQAHLDMDVTNIQNFLY